MATTSKASLRKALNQTASMDELGLSPFVGLHLGSLDFIHVYRTSSISLTHSDGAPDPQAPGWVFVHFDHLMDCLRCLESEDVEILILANGGVLLRTANSPFMTELRVHTIPRASTGFKQHIPGEPIATLDISWLGGFDASPIPSGMHPIIQGDSLIVLSNVGTIRWTTLHDPQVPSHPRLSFLKAISGMKEGVIDLTRSGYYHATVDGMHIYTGSHRQTTLQDAQVLAKGMDASVTIPAARLVQALKQAISVAEKESRIRVTPKLGVLAQDIYRNVDRFSLGDVAPFHPFSISQSTAKLLAETLCQQPQEAEATLTSVVNAPECLRITRGGCEANFRCQLIKN